MNMDAADIPSFQHHVRAQEYVGWANVMDELRSAHKQGCWMWFVFPQLANLGQSFNAFVFGLDGLYGPNGAHAYLDHPPLNQRLIAAMLHVEPLEDLLPVLGEIDRLKLRSSMTLFEATGRLVAPTRILDDHFGSEGRCEATLDFLASPGRIRVQHG